MEPLTPEEIAKLTGESLEAVAETPAVDAPADEPKPTDVLKANPSEPYTFKCIKEGKEVTVVIAKPTKATSLHVSKVLGANSANPMLDLYYKSLMWVKQVNGHTMPFLASAKAFEGLQDLLGDEGLEQLVGEVQTRLADAEAAFDWDAVKKS